MLYEKLTIQNRKGKTTVSEKIAIETVNTIKRKKKKACKNR